MDRTGLLTEIKSGRTRFESVLAMIPPAQMTEADLPGGWSMKDLVAHLGWWEQRAVEIYRELAAGGNPSRPNTPAELDAVNAQIYDRFHAKSLDDIRAFEQAAYREVLHLVETAPEDDLFNPRRFSPWMDGPFMQWILDNSTGHYEEHGPSLEKKQADRSLPGG